MTRRTFYGAGPLALAGLLIGASPAVAHPLHGAVGDFAAGFLHPFTGAGHVLAMTAIGLVAARAGGWSRLLLPAAFVVAVVVGARFLGGAPQVEVAIVLSVGVVGLLLLRSGPGATLGTLPVLAVLGLLHGGAHGVPAVGGVGAGLAVATASLCGAGVVAGHLALRWGRPGLFAVAGRGAIVAATGLMLML